MVEGNAITSERYCSNLLRSRLPWRAHGSSAKPGTITTLDLPPIVPASTEPDSRAGGDIETARGSSAAENRVTAAYRARRMSRPSRQS
jgi:hypothetical protein